MILKSILIQFISTFFYLSGGIYAQDNSITYSWPDFPFDQSKVINGTFCEFRNTGSSDHFHNAVDIGEPDGNPAYACLDGVVYSVVNDGSNSYVSVMSNINDNWKRLTYLHILPNPALYVGREVKARETILGSIYQGMGHVHLIERESVPNPDFNAAEINNIRPEGGMVPYTDYESPVIYDSSVKFYADNFGQELSSDALYGKVDIRVRVEERNGATSSGQNNGTYILGYKVWDENKSEIIYSPGEDGEVYRFYRMPSNSYVHNVFIKGQATLSDPIYWLTNGNGAEEINNTRIVSNNYLDTDLVGEGNYVLEIFSEDTRGNKVNAFYNISFATPPETPVLKAIVNTDKRHSVKAVWQSNTEKDLAGYRLYYSVNTQLSTWALAADESILRPEMNSYTFSSPDEFIEKPSSDIYFFYLTAVDTGGAESNPSDIYSRAPHENGSTYPTVLIVDGFDQYDGIGSWHKPTHELNSYYFVPLFISDSLVISSAAEDAITDGDIELADYDMVIWFTGDDGGPVKAITTEEQFLLQDYLSSGGNLIISGSEIGLDLDTQHNYSTENDSTFYRHYLKARFVQLGNGQMNIVEGKDATGFESVYLVIGQTYDENRPDDIDPANGSSAILEYNKTRNTGEPKIAGVAYKGFFGNGTQTGGMIYLPFTFETASDMIQRKEFMTSALEYFEIITSVDYTQINMPDEFIVNQNYPNPFNPATVIKVAVPNSSIVRLNIYNILGQQIKTVSKIIPRAGIYEFRWNGGDVPSGVYFANMIMNNNNVSSKLSNTIKMILLK